MRLRELQNKVPKGSQKRYKHPNATDDPEKYIGKWERYDEPQGINSKAAKKQIKEFGHAVRGGYTQRWAPSKHTPTGDPQHPTDVEAVKKSKKAPLKKVRKSVKSLSGRTQPNLKMREAPEDYPPSNLNIDITNDEPVKKRKRPNPRMDVINKNIKALSGGKPSNVVKEDVYKSKSPCVPLAILRATGLKPDQVQNACVNRNWSDRKGMHGGQISSTLKDLGVQYNNDNKWFFTKRKVKDRGYSTIDRLTLNQFVKKNPEGRFVVLVRGHAVAVINGRVYDDLDTGLKSKIDGVWHIESVPNQNQAPISETIRRPNYGNLDAEYEVVHDEKVVGKAKVEGGSILEFMIREDADQNYQGHIMNAILGTMIREADRMNANLSISVVGEQMHDLKNFLERFGFRHVGDNIMRRLAGSVSPPSVVLTRGLDGEG